jgi:protein TonB
MTRQEGRKLERNGLLISTVVHGVLFLIVFLIVWKQPVAPLEGGMSGVDLNFGYDDQGSGTNNSMDPVSADVSKEQTTDHQTEEASVPESAPTATEDVINASSNESATQVANISQTKETSPTQVKKTITTTTQAQVVSSQNTYKGGNTGDGDGTAKGNQGSQQGTLDGRNYYGQPGNGTGGPGGNGNGTSLEMNGWHWLKEPKINDASDEAGKIVFRIKVDDEGNLISVTPIEKQVSAAVVKKYEEAIWKIEFEKNRNNSNVESFSTGIITFIIRKN